jgi:hypothetical protein
MNPGKPIGADVLAQDSETAGLAVPAAALLPE